MALTILQNTDVHTLMNDSLKNALGDNAVLVSEDLTNVVDVGVALANANAYEHWLEGMAVATAKYIFSFRKYNQKAPNILRSTQEFGQLIQKIRSKLPETFTNQSYHLVDGASYDDNQFINNEVSVKIFKDRIDFECRKSITRDQLKTAFTNATELGSFVSMLFGLVENRLELAMEEYIFWTLKRYMAEVITNNDSVRCVHLLTEYKAKVPTADGTLTADKALYDEGFLIYASARIMDYKDLLARYNTRFNEEGFQNHTPSELLHVVLYNKFVQNMGTYAKSNTFNEEFLKLPKHETVAYWTGLGDGSDADRTTVKVEYDGNTLDKSYVLGFMFDHDGAFVDHDEPSREAHYVKSGQFFNYWYKEVIGIGCDFSENAICFLLD